MPRAHRFEAKRELDDAFQRRQSALHQQFNRETQELERRARELDLAHLMESRSVAVFNPLPNCPP